MIFMQPKLSGSRARRCWLRACAFYENLVQSTLLNPSPLWRLFTWKLICASLNHRRVKKEEPNRLNFYCRAFNCFATSNIETDMSLKTLNECFDNRGCLPVEYYCKFNYNEPHSSLHENMWHTHSRQRLFIRIPLEMTSAAMASNISVKQNCELSRWEWAHQQALFH